jgi:hypothetical protein
MIPSILFDRSIFHGDKFHQLSSSNLVEMVRRRSIRVFFTPMFVEETLHHALNDEEEFAIQWKFLGSLLGQKWFKFSREILAIELGDRIRGQNYYLQPKNRVRTTIRNSRAFVWKELPPEQLNDAMNRIQRNRVQDGQFRRSRLDLRAKPQLPLHLFSDYVEHHSEWVIQNLFMKEERNSSNFLDTWRNKRGSCHFTEQLLRASLATIFLAAADHQLKLGTNDMADSDQLAFLIWADILVSDDMRFMKKGFDLLYGGSDKRFMSLDQFLQYLNAAIAANTENYDAS